MPVSNPTAPPVPADVSSSTPEDVVRGRPGRRSAEDREEALLAGHASVDPLARRFGVHASTVEGWRAEALEGLRVALRRGTGRSEREVELEKENKLLRKTVTDGAIVQALLKTALEEERKKRPARPARSTR